MESRWSGWHGRHWRESHASDDDEDEARIDILPDVIQGWLLLEKAGLDVLEKSIIQSDIKSRFTLEGVENSLRAHWTDEQVRKRDGADDRHEAHFEELDEASGPETWAEEYFKDWHPQDVVLFQEAQDAKQRAWMQIQEGRRTLREARAKQKEVRLGRRFFPSKGRGRGKDHATRSCPQKATPESTKALQVDAESEFVYYGDHEAETLFGDHHMMHEQGLVSDSQKMTTHEAMARGRRGHKDYGINHSSGACKAGKF